jgi:hypothetical protein
MRNAVKAMEDNNLLQSDTQKDRIQEILRLTSASVAKYEDADN